MNFEWDIAKNISNIEKHGVDFETVNEFGWSDAVIVRSSYAGEARFEAYGYLGNRVHVVVYTPRGNNRRIISMRRANVKEIEKNG